MSYFLRQRKYHGFTEKVPTAAQYGDYSPQTS